MKKYLLVIGLLIGTIYTACNNKANNGQQHSTDSAITDTTGMTMTDSGVVDTTAVRPREDSVLMDTANTSSKRR